MREEEMKKDSRLGQAREKLVESLDLLLQAAYLEGVEAGELKLLKELREGAIIDTPEGIVKLQPKEK